MPVTAGTAADAGETDGDPPRTQRQLQVEEDVGRRARARQVGVDPAGNAADGPDDRSISAMCRDQRICPDRISAASRKNLVRVSTWERSSKLILAPVANSLAAIGLVEPGR